MVRVPGTVLAGLEVVRLEGRTNMFDRKAVQFYANEHRAHETVAWLEEHPAEYSRGLFEGFIAEDPDA